MAGPYAARFLKQEKTEADLDDSDLDLLGRNRIESLLGLDTRLSQVDRDFLLRFFESLGLATVADLQDVGAFEPLPDYLRTSLEAYQKKQGYEAAKSGAMRATLGCLLKRLEEEAASKVPVKEVSPATKLTAATALGRITGRKAKAGLAVRETAEEVRLAHDRGSCHRISRGSSKSRPSGWQLALGTLRSVSNC